MTRGARILVAVGDAASSAPMAGALDGTDHEVRTCPSLAFLEHYVVTYRPDLVVLALPAGDPELVTAIVRRTHASYRPLVLCCLDDPAGQRTAALEAGADAWIERPWTSAQLELHVRVLLRRAPWLARTVHRVGELMVDEDAHVATFRNQVLELTAKDFGVLAMLARNVGTVLSKRHILEELWGYDTGDENLVEVHVSALRRSLPSTAGALVQTVRGVGYVLREDAPQVRLA